ncbi:hypothetical protein [Nannocystis punicea]|uniref:Uncharacterized protein n=1 Tax=Nannocystis punicea TaxID=2995304 RepID=A0ABY7GXX1_9BACT|nr:hypothetical protein [Nannocystis poenicansa]WAS91828.1 hypothetical protein O0S08_37065 [Nannocystis poenicansa]
MSLSVPFATFALVASLLGTGPAPGGASDRIAVVGDADDEAIVRQLRAELSALGFEVLAPEAPAEGDELWADDLGAVAAIRVVEHEALEIHIADRVAGKSVRHRVAIPQPHTEEDARIVAMRAIELLRASLREPQEAPVVSPPPPRPSPPSTPSTPSPPRPAAPRFFIHLAPAVAGSPGGLGPSLHALLGLRWMPHRHLGLAIQALAPTVGTVASGPEGTARIHTALVLAGLHVSFVRSSARWQPDAGVGIGPAFLRMRGSAAPAYGDATEVVASAAFAARFGLAVAVHPRVRLRLDGHIGALVPRPLVRFAGRTVADWGRPFGIGALGVEIVLP